MSEHTPGPWTTDAQYIIRDSNGDEIATCAIAAQLLSARANAALIAAAPDMLTALKVALEWIDGDIPEDGSWGRVEMIRDAIAKAEGAQ